MALQRFLVRVRSASLVAGVVALVLVAGGTTATSSSTILTVAGTGPAVNTGDGGQAREASIDEPRSLFAVDGGYVWAQPWSNRVRIVDSEGIVRTLAGTGVAGYSGDGGPATEAKLNFVHSAAPTADGGFLIADTLNSRIRKISASGIITTVAGTGSAGYSGDNGPATSARINNPRGVVALPDGGFLFPDTNNHRVRRVAPNGIITTVAGTGVQGFSGDGGLATAARLSSPFAVAPTPDGGFLVIDVGNQRIRKVDASGIITTVAGTGVKGFSGDGGPATSAQLADPHNLAVFPDGSFLIADASNERVRLVDASGTITTLAGTGVRGFSGDGGPAGSAQLAVPKAVAVTPSGDVLIADEQNNRIRFVGTIVAPQNASPPTIGGSAVQGQTLSAHPGGWTGTGPLPSYQWERCSPGCSAIPGATAKVYVPTAADVGSRLRVTVTASNPAGSASASSAQTDPISAPVTPPVNTAPPVVSGTAAEGQTLTVSTGTWSGTQPMTFSYEWLRCNTSGNSCTPIPGATAADYTVTGADVGSRLRARVTASNGGSVYGSAVTADSPSAYWRFGGTGPLVDSVGTANGSFTGSVDRETPGLLVGDTDTAARFDGAGAYADVPASSAWTPSAFSIEVLVRPDATPDNRTIWSTQGSFTGWWLNTGPGGNVRMFIGDGSAWRRGPDGPVLEPGRTYHVVATYDGANAKLYVDGDLVSTSPAVTMVPNGGANVMRFAAFSTGPGQYWPGTIDEASFYPSVLTPAQIAAHRDASLTGSLAESSATAIVSGAPPVNVSLPVVTGQPVVGQLLSASDGTWSGSAPMTFAYRWQRCAPGCADIGGATSSSYTVVPADIGVSLRAVVTATNGAGSAEAASVLTGVVTDVPASGSMTFSVTVGGDDGDVGLSGPQGSGYPPSGTAEANSAGSVFTAGRRLAFGSYQVLAGLLRFDTSALPDGATVTGARLRVYVKKKADADGRNLVAEWLAASSWPIDPADWSLTSSGSALAGADITGISTNAVNTFVLTGVSAVSTTGSTALRLHVSGGQPAGDNYVQMAAFEDPSLPAPELVVDYVMP